MKKMLINIGDMTIVGGGGIIGTSGEPERA